MMHIFQKKLYLPAFSIIAVVSLLLVLIGISTYRNLNREKQRVLSFVHRQGLTLIHALEAGTRSEMIMHIWQKDMVASLIREAAKSDDIAYIYLSDGKGQIIHHSDPSHEGEKTIWNPQEFKKSWVLSRIVKLPNGTQVYEIAKRFTPFQSLPSTSSAKEILDQDPYGAAHLHANDIIVLGLNLLIYETYRKADLHHAVIMAVILLLLGASVFFFIFVVQNYYLVERTLQKTENYAQQVVSSMANGLLSIDTDGRIVSYNSVAVQLFGLEKSTIRAMNLSSVIDFQSSGIQQTLDQLRTTHEREILFQKSNSEIMPLSISTSPVIDENGTCSGAVIVIRDLREIKRLEEKVRRSEKLAAIGKLAAGISHEIRNPLSSIRGFAQFLRHALKDKPQEREYTEVMIKEMDRINRVVSDLLSFAGQDVIEPAPTNVTKLVEHVIRLVEPETQEKKVEIHSSVVSGLDEIPLDAYKITQVLLNLILNALQFNNEGNIRVTAELDEENSQLIFQVEDDGPGIPPENKEKVFDPFFTTREKGTGLGLAIVHKIVESHRGEIWVDSPLPGKNEGCRFTIAIPVSRSNITR
jgi:two-component system sensor histidine kinase HydH